MAYGDDGSIRMRPSQSTVMKRNVGSTIALTTVRSRLVALGDRPPVVDARAAEWIDAELEAGAADSVEVDDVGKVVDVGREVVVAMGGRRAQRPVIRDAFHAARDRSPGARSPRFDPAGRRRRPPGRHWAGCT